MSKNEYEAKAWAEWSMLRWCARGAVLVSLTVVASALYGCPRYRVWQQGLEGEGELRRAEQNRQIVVQEAEARKQAARALADAEIERASGVAEANRVIGDSLKGNEAYLRWLWIDGLNNPAQGARVVYIPTEAGLPILEAGK